MCDVNDVIIDDVTCENNKLLVKSWNVGGKFVLKMSCLDFCDCLKMYHINFFPRNPSVAWSGPCC